MTERWDAECSMLAHLVAADDGEPLSILEADLCVRVAWIINETLRPGAGKKSTVWRL